MRFPEFTEEWEEHALAEYLDFKNGLNPDVKRIGRGLPFISVMDILADGTINYDSIRGKVEATEREIENFSVGKFFLCLVAIYLMLTFAQKQNMTETIAYIKESLRDLYPSSEVSSLVRLIMERVCNIQPHHFLFCKDKELPESEKSRIHDIVERLKQMEPIQYILGTADFYSLQFEVDPSVLIPRPETEELVEQVILDNADKKIKILDIGTGSGCIAVTLRKHLKKASVIATDISAEALATARRNAKRNNTTVTFIQTDILDPEKAEMDIPFILDVIVSNPPYIKEEEKKDMERNVLDYEPHLALFVPDNDPLLYYWHIAHFGKKKLRRNGRLYFEINAACGNMVVEMLEEEGYKNIELIQDLSGRDRIIKARK